jgi:cytochrome c-type biogenesis protein CcmF
VAVAAGVTLALHRSWFGYSIVTVIAAGAVFIVAGGRVGVFLIAPALASLLYLGLGLARSRPRGRLLTVHLAHLGVSLFLVGVAGSSFGADFSGTMMPGDTITVGGHEISLDRVETGEGDRYVFVRAVVDVDGRSLAPEIRAYEEQTVPVAEPVVRSSPVDDVIVAVSLLFPDGETVEVSVFVRPLVWWVWAGAVLMGLAGLVALFARDGAAAGPRRSATAGRQRGETTSGAASP